jgi:hypothetical protein
MAILIAKRSIQTGAVTSPFKYTPGHYLMFDQGSGGGTDADKQALMADFANEANLVGFFAKLRWKNIETAEDVYNLALIHDYLDALPPGKKFILAIREQLFGGGVQTDAHGMFPAYLDGVGSGPYFYTGGTAWSGDLTVALNDDEAVAMDRKIALYTALLTEFDDDDRLEMLVTGETAVGALGVGYSAADHGVQYERFAQAIGAFPGRRTPVNISTNYLGNTAIMQSLVDACVDEQISIGGPDTMPRDERQFDDADIYLGIDGSPLTDYRGLVPRFAQVDGTEIGGYLGNFTPEQIWNDPSYGHVNMRPTHWPWYHNLPGRGPDSTPATQWGDGVSQGILWWIRNHRLDSTNTTNPYGGSGSDPIPDPGGTGPIVYVATGSVAENDAAAVTPAYGATPQADDVGLVMGFLRAHQSGRSLTCSGYTLIDSFGFNGQEPLGIFGKVLTAAEGPPTLVPVGAAAGDVLQALTILLRSAELPISALLHVAGHKSTTGANNSTPILTPAITVTQDNCLIVLMVIYQADCTSMGAYNPNGDGAWTQRAFQSTITGNNQSIAVYTRLQTTAANIAASTITISGQTQPLLARTIAVALKANT